MKVGTGRLDYRLGGRVQAFYFFESHGPVLHLVHTSHEPKLFHCKFS